MLVDSKSCLTYVLTTGDEKTITLDPDKLNSFVEWYQDVNSNNYYDVAEEMYEKTTLYKNTIVFVKY